MILNLSESTYELWKIKECDEYVKRYRKEPTQHSGIPFQMTLISMKLKKHSSSISSPALIVHVIQMQHHYQYAPGLKGRPRGHNPYAEKLAQRYLG